MNEQEVNAIAIDDVVAFLKDHPDFLIEYAHELGYEEHGGKVRSFTEAQLAAQKSKNQKAHERLQFLIQNAKDNDATIEKMLKMDLALMAVNTVKQLYASVKQVLTGEFGMPNFALKVAVQGNNKNIRMPEALKMSDALLQTIQNASNIRCTQKVLHDDLWLDLDASQAESFLYLPLFIANTDVADGMLIIAHQDPQHFSSDLQTDCVAHLATAIGVSLKRVLRIK